MLPFDSSADQLYEEHVRDGDSLDTRALDFIRRELGQPGLRLLLLTGDAGHGKTHLCARLLADRGLGSDQLSRALLERCDGRSSIVQLPNGRGLRIVKDLSELDRAQAREVLADSLTDEATFLVACANEGRLPPAPPQSHGRARPRASRRGHALAAWTPPRARPAGLRTRRRGRRPAPASRQSASAVASYAEESVCRPPPHRSSRHQLTPTSLPGSPASPRAESQSAHCRPSSAASRERYVHVVTVAPVQVERRTVGPGEALGARSTGQGQLGRTPTDHRGPPVRRMAHGAPGSWPCCRGSP